jgi:hypothetical protein
MDTASPKRVAQMGLLELVWVSGLEPAALHKVSDWGVQTGGPVVVAVGSKGEVVGLGQCCSERLVD